MAFIILGFITLLLNCPSLVVSLNEEGSALLSFKGSLTSYRKGCFENWNASDETPCSWLGVKCRNQKVIGLSLPNRGISGSLSTDIGKLSALRHLNLRYNKLSGGLPPDIAKLVNLLSLDLSQNSFNGSVTSSLMQCKRLKTLLLNENSFSGPLPVELGTSLTSLRALNLSFNRFDGSIPPDIGNSPSLIAALDLSHNLFTGRIPSNLGNLPETLYINLSFNNLSGPIPQLDTLINLGPPAFVGNPFLCGLPLKNLCPSGGPQPLIHRPTVKPESNYKPNSSKHHLGIVIVIIVGILTGTFIIGLLVSYSCKNIKGSKHIGGCNFEETSIIRKDMFCFAQDVLETLSESMEQYKFVRLDQKINFNVDQLLTASAFFLGKSGLGIVYKVVLENGVTLVVRRLGDGGGSQRFRDFQNEVEAIGKIKHPNILALKAYCWSVDEKLLIYDYVANGDLATAIHGKPGMVFFTPLSWPVRLQIMKGIARGLTHLHDCSPKKYVHGNLKPSNILLGHNMEPQISDLGLCRLANKSGESPSHSEQSTSETTPQTLPYEFISTTSSPAAALGLHYKAPEVSGPRKPLQKWDVYSFGVIMLEMISGKLPVVHVGSTEMDIVRWFYLIIEENKPFIDILDPFLAHDLDMQDEIIAALKIALSCVQKSPEKRPSMRHVYDLLARLG